MPNSPERIKPRLLSEEEALDMDTLIDSLLKALFKVRKAKDAFAGWGFDKFFGTKTVDFKPDEIFFQAGGYRISLRYQDIWSNHRELTLSLKHIPHTNNPSDFLVELSFIRSCLSSPTGNKDNWGSITVTKNANPGGTIVLVDTPEAITAAEEIIATLATLENL